MRENQIGNKWSVTLRLNHEINPALQHQVIRGSPVESTPMSRQYPERTYLWTIFHFHRKECFINREKSLTLYRHSVPRGTWLKSAIFRLRSTQCSTWNTPALQKNNRRPSSRNRRRASCQQSQHDRDL